MLSIVLVCALLTYGGVSLFVVVFAVYPFAAEMFRQGDIPKRLIPGTIALGAFTFTMDALPGTPQIQNIIPTTFFKTDTWAAPWLGVIGALFILVDRPRLPRVAPPQAAAARRGLRHGARQRAGALRGRRSCPNPWLAISPLVVVGVMNKVLTQLIPRFYGPTLTRSLPGLAQAGRHPGFSVAAIWAVEGALLLGILTVFAFAFGRLKERFADGSKAAVAGRAARLHQYRIGVRLRRRDRRAAGLPRDRRRSEAIPGALINEAITVTALAGITGSASGGMSIALAAMADTFIAAAHSAGIPLEVLHRVAAMASGGMDTLPHNGAVITLLAVTGLTHKEAYRDIFAITLLKTAAVAVAIGVFYATGI